MILKGPGFRTESKTLASQSVNNILACGLEVQVRAKKNKALET